MLHAMTLSVALVLSSAPANLGPAPALETPAPVDCAIAQVDRMLAPILVADLGDPIPPDYCFEDCDALPDISCSGSVCTAVSRNCSVGERGYVTCDGNTTFCSEPCDPEPECENDDVQFVRLGYCCDCYQSPGEVTETQQCIDGQWVTTGTSCFPSSLCPACP